jgi:hypothetical protein
MRQKLFSAIILFMTIAMLVTPLVVVGALPQKGVNVPKAPTDIDTIDKLYEQFGTYFSFIYGVLLGIAVIWFIFAGFRYLTAGGDPELTKAARQNIFHALVGLAVMLGAGILVALVSSLLGITAPVIDIIPGFGPGTGAAGSI